MQWGLNASMSQTLAQRLRAARKDRDWTQEDLAKRSGVLQSDISKIERGQTLRPLGLLALASAPQCDPFWLETGNGQKSPTVGNVTPAKARSQVPLISWVAAGNWGEVTDMFQPGEAEEYVEVYETAASSNTFALRVSGDSMVSPYPGDHSFPPGTILIVDPNRASNAGDFVIAKDVATQMATFKKLVHDAGRWFLKPLNPAYPTV